MLRLTVLSAALAAGWAFLPAQSWWPLASGEPDYFTPSHRLTGVGVDRKGISDEVIEKRAELMTEAQTFGIMRDPHALTGAERVTSPRMQTIFKEAARRSGIRASLITAIAYLESWGETTAKSPTGPKGVMQIASGTARTMGLRQVYATKYKVTTSRQHVRTKKGHSVSRTVRRRTRYTVLVRDERMQPSRAIPAAAVYLSRLEQRYGSIDWAIFAYHCGEGCVNSMKALLEQTKGVKPPYTVAKLFFEGSPANNRELYEAVQREMARDYSPTYYFRVMRAEQLLQLYKEDPAAFKKLAAQYRYEPNPLERAPHRLSVWLKAQDLQFQNCDDLKREEGKHLARVFDDPSFFGFRLRKDQIGAADLVNQDYYLQATPAAAGTLTYIAYETRRLYDAMKTKEGSYVPLDVTSLVQPLSLFQTAAAKKSSEAVQHCTGQVFDINYRNLPVSEREALDFVLADMGWHGYLGFVEENPGSGALHIGASPSSREFFTDVYEDALKAKKSGS